MNNMKKAFLTSAISLFLFMSMFGQLHAQEVPAAKTNPTVPAATKTTCTTNCPPAASNQPLNIHLENPLQGVSTIPDAINKILSVVIRIALPIIIVMFIWSGILFIFAQGNEKKLGQAKNIFFYTIIGTLLILGAWTITNAIVGTVNSIVN